MNKFNIMPCISQEEVDEESKGGFVVPLSGEVGTSCIIFFPVADKVAEVVNLLLGVEDTDTGIDQEEIEGSIDLYKTMVNSWRTGDRFVSGVHIDIVYSKEKEEDILDARLILSSTDDGYVEAIIKINFAHALIVSLLEEVEVTLSGDLLNAFMPDLMGGEEPLEALEDSLPEEGDYPVDENIAKIAKSILNGKIKE